MVDNKYENNYPIDMICNNGKKEYAYITMLIINELYTPASIVLAESLKKIGSIAELVIMIDNNISNDTINLLRRFYDKIIKVKKIEINHKNNVQKYILTKLLGLELDYKKIIIIDIDSIILKYPDNSFGLSSPSIVFDNNNKIRTGYIVIEPDKNLFNKIMDKIEEKDLKKKLEKEEKPLEYLIKKMFNNINKLDNKILSFSEDNAKDKMEESYGIQYTINKPFIIESKIPIETRITWEQYKLWYYYFRNIINKYPDIEKYEYLKETIEFSKYFVQTISRFVLEDYEKNKKNKNNKSEIDKIYNISRNSKNNEYYHLNVSKEYDSTNLNFLIKNNSISSFIEYIKNKTDLIPNNSYTNIVDIKSLLYKINENQEHLLLDYILTEYVRTNSNIFIILMINEFENVDGKEDKIDETNLIWTNRYKLMGMVIKNILFNINQNYVYDQRIDMLSSYNEYTFYDVQILIYQTVYPLYFNNLNNNVNNINNVNNKKIYIINDTNSKVRFSSIFMNRNTMNMIKNNKISFYKNDKMDKKKIIGLLKFQTIKKWIYNNYTGDQICNIIIIKSNPITIIDNNEYSIINMKLLSSKVLEKMKIIYSKSKLYNNIIKEYLSVIKNIDNPKYYWELEGIKFFSKKIF